MVTTESSLQVVGRLAPPRWVSTEIVFAKEATDT